LPTELLITPNDRERLENETNIITRDTARLKPALIARPVASCNDLANFTSHTDFLLGSQKGTLKAH